MLILLHRNRISTIQSIKQNNETQQVLKRNALKNDQRLLLSALFLSFKIDKKLREDLKFDILILN